MHFLLSQVSQPLKFIEQSLYIYIYVAWNEEIGLTAPKIKRKVFKIILKSESMSDRMSILSDLCDQN